MAAAQQTSPLNLKKKSTYKKTELDELPEYN